MIEIKKAPGHVLKLFPVSLPFPLSLSYLPTFSFLGEVHSPRAVEKMCPR